MATQIQNLQKQLVQLRQEANVQRIPVSQAIEEILKYTSQHASDDALVVGLPQSDNPFRDVKGCSIL